MRDALTTLLWTLLGTPFAVGAALLLWRGWSAFEAMAPNEWGDLLVGMFGSASFAVLGLAYLAQRDELAMQRQELRNNTAALELQREELATLARESEAQNAILREQAERADVQGRIAEWSVVRGELDVILAALFRGKMGYERSSSDRYLSFRTLSESGRTNAAVEQASRSIALPSATDLPVWFLSETPARVPASSNPVDEWSGKGWEVTIGEEAPALVMLNRYCTAFRTFMLRVPRVGFLGADFFRGSAYADVDARAAELVRAVNGPDALPSLPWEERCGSTPAAGDF